MEEDNENYFSDTGNTEYLFCEYIKRSHDRNCTVEDWIERVKDENSNGAAYDDSYAYEDYVVVARSYASEKDEKEYEYSDCVGCGRIFDEEYLDKNNYDRVIEENFDKLVELYKKYEGPQPSCAMECLAGENFTS